VLGGVPEIAYGGIPAHSQAHKALEGEERRSPISAERRYCQVVKPVIPIWAPLKPGRPERRWAAVVA